MALLPVYGRGLLTTGSADFHAPDHRLFSRFRAFELYGLMPNQIAAAIAKAAQKKKCDLSREMPYV